MGIYGQAAIRATEYFLQSKATSLEEAWQSAIAEFSAKLSSRRKSCPKNAFLGLCEAGVISGIVRGKYDAPSNNKNGRYAVKAYRVLQSEPNLSRDKAALWTRAVQPEAKKENEQMDVVISLWNKKLLH